MESNATSATIVGSTTRTRPWSAIVWSRNHRVISAISASVSPVYALPLAVPPLDRGDDHVERGERPLDLEPRHAAAPRRVGADRVLDHQALVAAVAGLVEDALQLLDGERLLDPGEEERRPQPQPLEQAPALEQRQVHHGLAVQGEDVEHDEDDRHVAAHALRHLLAAESPLQLEEREHVAIAMCEHLAV